MTGPRALVFVAGTGTEVGKTWWTAAIARAVRDAGQTVAARKPVQSGAAGSPRDSDVLAAVTGEHPLAVCPAHRTYDLAWAPPMAARELGRPSYTVGDLADEIAWPDEVAVGLVEGVGGPRSPIAFDGDNVDLAHALQPHLVVVVGDAGLGTINAVRLSVDAFDDFPVIVALNRFGDDPLHARNREFLVERADLDVVTEPSHLATRLL